MPDHALLLGINQYETVSDLRGCENDVRNVASLLKDLHGFADSSIRQLLNADVNKPNVRDGLDWLLDGASPGDRLVLHFSGHGSYIDSPGGDEAVDELICLHDMQWKNPDSYFRDDELGAFARRVSPGVRLTVVLDACHSGTGTRALGDRRSAKAPLLIERDTEYKLAHVHSTVANLAAMGQMLSGDDPRLLAAMPLEQLVVARVVEPNKRALRELRARVPRVKRFGACLKRDTLNHQLLAGAADDQTAADAFISGDYHGAFTFHLCQAARSLGSSATTAEIVDRASTAIRQAGFSQNPQNEGPFLQDPLFGQHQQATTPLAPGAAPVDSAQSSPKPTISEGIANNQAQLSHFLRIADRFLDIVDRLVPQAPGKAAAALLPRAPEAIAYVHGISRHVAGYSNAWFNAVRPHLDRVPAHHEVLWSPIVNPSNLRVRATPRSLQERQFIEDVENELARRLPDVQRTAARSAVRGSGFSIDDFARYMFDEDIRNQILTEFDNVVRPLLESGATINLVSHSWGTVVSWEGLRRLDAAPLAGRVENLFVVGAALSIGPVVSNLFQRIGDGRLPAKVTRCVNLDASGDIVGGSIEDDFDVADEFLDLDPTGCGSFLGIVNPSCAHSSYFDDANLAVNRGIFARFINA